MAKRKCVSKIGGQAVLEGVMMRGVTAYATAVRNPAGDIVVESERLHDSDACWKKIPVLRGFLNFFGMMGIGVKIIMRSAEVFGEGFEEEEPSRFEKWLSKTLHVDVMTIAMIVGVVLGVGLAVALFMLLPNVIAGAVTGGIAKAVAGDRNAFNTLFANESVGMLISNLLEGLVRIILFVAYIAATSLMKDIRRLYQYHGAEHKTIACFEHDLPLTVENARTMSKHHDRCGTNFMVIVMLVSILIFSLVESILGLCGWTAESVTDSRVLVRLIYLAIRLALLPFVAGFAYELLKFLAKFDNWFVKALKAPGMAMQLLTTREPDDSMLEVAIKAFTTVQALDADPDMATTSFEVKKSYERCRHEVVGILEHTADKEVLADWIFVEVTGVRRSELPTLSTISENMYKKAVEYAKQVAAGEPLQYVVGTADFYGYTLKVDKRVLIPRPETEQVTEKALEYVRDGMKVLDMCTGSGAIAIVIAAKTGAEVTAADVSADAIDVARQNAVGCGVTVNFVQSDLYENIEGEYDLIVSNPPYIRRDEMAALPPCVRKEPAIALDGGEDGLDYYRRIIEAAPLVAGGILVLEIGAEQGDAVRALLSARFDTVEIYKDYNGLDRIALAK